MSQKTILTLKKISLLSLQALLMASVLCGFNPRPVLAQAGATRFETLSVEDGLSQNTVYSILQDSQGFMWFGTDDGLNEYDGYTFTTFKNDPDNPLTLSNNTILSIFEDSRHNLWFGTAQGLNRLDRKHTLFTHYLDNPSDPNSLSGMNVNAIAEDPQGYLWVGTSDGGLNKLDVPTGSFEHFQHDPHRAGSLISDNVTALRVDKKGGMWVGTDNGVDYYSFKTGLFKHYQNDPKNPGSLSDNKIQVIYLDTTGILWAGTEEGGLNRLNPNGSFTRYLHNPDDPSSLVGNYIRAILQDSSGRLWVGGRNALHLLDPSQGKFSHYQHDPDDPHSLTNDYILSIFEDHSGVVWIGTYSGGLSKYNQSNDRFTLFQHEPGVTHSLSNNLVNAIFEDRQGSIWVGTTDGGLNRLNSATNTFSTFVNNPEDEFSLGSNDVRAIDEDHLGSLWIGTYGGGLNRLDRATGKFQRFRYDPTDPNSLSDSRVMVIYEDRRGYLWVGTRDGGLNLLDRKSGQFTRYQNDPKDPHSLTGNYIHAIFEDQKGFLWIGTDTGISVIDPNLKVVQRYVNDPDNPSTLSNNRVLSFYETADGVLWIGTLLGGLNRFDRNTQVFSHYTEKSGLANDAVYGILGDQQGSLWMSTNKGLSHFNSETETFRNYDVRDGLQSNEFSAGAYFKNQQGIMFFGGVQGYNEFDPRKLQDNPVAPPVVITAFKKFNQVARTDLADGENITLSYQENFISFEFSALDFSSPNKNQYAYMLEGFDKDWVYAGTRRYASYTNLRGGDYTFRVKGTNKDGVWNEIGTSVHIHVIPPLWEEWWFVGGLILLLGGSAAAAFWLRIRQDQHQHRKLEEQVSERTAEIARSASEIERRRQVAEGLREILSILNSNKSLKESLDSITKQAIRLMNADGVIIFRCGGGATPPGLPGEKISSVVVTSTMPHNLPQPPALFTADWISTPLLSGQSYVLQDVASRKLVDPELKGDLLRFGALLAVPFMVNDAVDGGLVLAYHQARIFSEEDLQTARSFADHAALAIANAQLRSQAEELAVTNERSRLARDLHDAVTQTLFATSLIADVLPRLWERSPEAGKKKLNEIRELTRGALAEMRTLLMELRPASLEDIPLHDLLRQLSEAFIGRARVPVALDLDSTISIPPGPKVGFYRIAQEALNNISKHAKASRVEIHLSQNGEQTWMEICDDGIGFDARKISPDHFGLGIMQERAQSIEAILSVDSQAEQGTRLTITWKSDDSFTAHGFTPRSDTSSNNFW